MSTIKKILIVGGGSAGWMSAAYLSKKLKFLDITLIESPKVSTVGVGESTLGHINKFLDSLELCDEDWMAECDATYKTSIKFTDFREKNSYFHYPFGQFNLDNTTHGIMDWFWYSALNKDKVSATDFAEMFVHQVLMTDKQKMTANENNQIPGFNFHLDTAYHMDAEKFGIFLKDKIAIPNGVKHIRDTIIKISQRPDLSIDKIYTEDNRILDADLYIDATGFQKLLIEKTMKTKFLGFDDVLMNDSALAARIPYENKEKQMHSVTNCTAIENGWVWDIPLWSRKGSGYVYSSKFVSQDQAQEQFKKHLKKEHSNEIVENLEFKNIKIRHGVQDQPWIKNVCAIGLALGFIEPLESTGLLTTHENIIRLGATLDQRQGYVNQFDIDGWNLAAREELEGFKQFVALHYGLSMRDDTPYWQHVTQHIHYDPEIYNLTSKLRTNTLDLMYRLNITNEVDSTHPAGETFIMAGMGLNPISKAEADLTCFRHPEAYYQIQSVCNEYKVKKRQMLDYIETLPSHYEFLKKGIYKNAI